LEKLVQVALKSLSMRHSAQIDPAFLEKARSAIHDHAEAGARLREEFFRTAEDTLIGMALRTAAALASGNKALLCGNGGSAADAQHLAGEFVNRFLLDRPPLAAIALSTDSSVLTAIGNDFAFDLVFQKQVQALGQAGDILIGLSTSGNSANVLKAMQAARGKGMLTFGLTGKGGGDMASLSDMLLDVPSSHTPLIQEVHIAAGHLLCQLTDHFLFENVAALAPLLSGAPEPTAADEAHPGRE
jgi:D-sedoheptulose 7-phosphate isomerase